MIFEVGATVGVLAGTWWLLRHPAAALALFAATGPLKAMLATATPTVAEHVDFTLLLAGIITVGSATSHERGRRRALHPLRSREVLTAAIALLTFASLLATSYFWSPAPDYGLDKTLRFLLLTPVAFGGAVVVFRSNDTLPLFARTALIFAGLSAVMYLTGQGERVRFGVQYISWGRLFGMGALAAWYLVSRGQASGAQRITELVLGGVCIAALVMTAARGPLLAFLVGGTILLLWSVGSQRQALSSSRLVSLVSGTFLTWIIVVSPAGIADVVWSRLDINSLGNATDPRVLSRADAFPLAVDAFEDSPLWGKGVGGFAMFARGYDGPEYPHNLLLEVVSETGLLGTVPLFVFLGLIISMACAIDTQRASPFGPPFLGALFAFWLMNSMVSGDLNDNRSLFLVAGIIVAEYGFTAIRPPARRRPPVRWQGVA